MRVLVFDTETTGFNPGSICQLSYVMKNGDDVKAKNFFFKVEYIEPGAQRVHGLSVELLRQLSQDKRFVDHFEEIRHDFEISDIWAAHNFDFDLKFIGTEFKRCRHYISDNKGFCTMKHFTPICKLAGSRAGFKFPKLEELVGHLGISRQDIEKATVDLFDVNGANFHDARYDTVSTYLCYIKGLEKGHIS